jgi:hypothetical protein
LVLVPSRGGRREIANWHQNCRADETRGFPDFFLSLVFQTFYNQWFAYSELAKDAKPVPFRLKIGFALKTQVN